MRKETLNGQKFEFYDDIASLPVERFHQYSRYMLVASGVGDSLDDIDKHIGRILQFLENDVKKARQEVLNLRQNLFMVLNQLDVHHKGFFFLTKSVNGEPWLDFSDDGIQELFKLAQGASVADINKVLSEVVRKIDDGLHQYFPEMFDDSVDKNYCELLRKRAMLQVDEILNGSDNSEALSEIAKEISAHFSPKDFENDKAIVEFDKQFENMCLILSKEFQGGVKGYTVMEFYSAYNLLREQQKEMKKHNKKKK